MADESLHVGIDASTAKAGADTYKAALTSITTAVEDFDKRTTASFDRIKAKMKSLDFSEVSKAVSQLNGLRINPSLPASLNAISTALSSFKAPPASVANNLHTFALALNSIRMPNVNVGQLAALSSAISTFKPPTAAQTQNLRDFVQAINTMHVNNANIAQIEAALNRVAAAATRAHTAVSGLNSATANIRAPIGGGAARGAAVGAAVGGARGNYGPRSGGAGGGGSGPYDGIFSGSQRATGELRGLENVANPSFQSASVLRTMVPALTTGEMFKSLYDEGTRLTQFQHVLEIATTVPNDALQSQRNLSDAMKTVSDTSNKYGLDIDKTREGFSHFAVNMKMANFTMDETKHSFDSISSSMRALGTDATRQDQVWRALNTTLANGKVMSTQLTRQFDQALPGFKEVLASVTFLEKHGKTLPNDQRLSAADQKTAGLELVDQLKKGMVSPEAVLKAFDRLKELTLPGLERAMQSATSQTMRFNSAWRDTQDMMLRNSDEGGGGVWKAMGEEIGHVTDILRSADVQKFFKNMALGIVDALHLMGSAAQFVADHLNLIVLAFKAFIVLGAYAAIFAIGGAFVRMGETAAIATRSLFGLIPAMRAVNASAAGIGASVGFRGAAAAALGWVALAAAIGTAAISYKKWEEVKDQQSSVVPGATNKEAVGGAIDMAKESGFKLASDAGEGLLTVINSIMRAFDSSSAGIKDFGSIVVAFFVGLSAEIDAFAAGAKYILGTVWDFPKNVKIVFEAEWEFLKGVWETIKTSIIEFPHNVSIVFNATVDVFYNVWNDLKAKVIDIVHSVYIDFIPDVSKVWAAIRAIPTQIGIGVAFMGETIFGSKNPAGPTIPNRGNTAPTGFSGEFGNVPLSGVTTTSTRSPTAQSLINRVNSNRPVDRGRFSDSGYGDGNYSTNGGGTPDRKSLQDPTGGGGKKGAKDKTENELDALEKTLGTGIGEIAKFLDQKKILDDALAKGMLSKSAAMEGLSVQQMYDRDMAALTEKIKDALNASTAYGKAKNALTKEEGLLNGALKLGIIDQNTYNETLARSKEAHQKVLDPIGAEIKLMKEQHEFSALGAKDREIEMAVLKIKQQMIKDGSLNANGSPVDGDQAALDKKLQSLREELKINQQLQQYYANQNVGLQAWANSIQDIYTELGKLEGLIAGDLTNSLAKFMDSPKDFTKNGGLKDLLKTMTTQADKVFAEEGIKGLMELTGLTEDGKSPTGSVVGKMLSDITGIDFAKNMGHTDPTKQSIGGIMAANGGALPVSIKEDKTKDGSGGLLGGGTGSKGGMLGGLWNGLGDLMGGSTTTKGNWDGGMLGRGVSTGLDWIKGLFKSDDPSKKDNNVGLDIVDAAQSILSPKAGAGGKAGQSIGEIMQQNGGALPVSLVGGGAGATSTGTGSALLGAAAKAMGVGGGSGGTTNAAGIAASSGSSGSSSFQNTSLGNAGMAIGKVLGIANGWQNSSLHDWLQGGANGTSGTNSNAGTFGGPLTEGGADSGADLVSSDAGSAAASGGVDMTSSFDSASEGGITGSFVGRASLPAYRWSGAKHYLEGTDNTSGGMPAIVHPNEAVIPLSRGRKVPVELAGGGGGSGGAASGHGPINVTIQANDPNAFRNSEGQIHNSIGKAVARATQRNG